MRKWGNKRNAAVALALCVLVLITIYRSSSLEPPRKARLLQRPCEAIIPNKEAPTLVRTSTTSHLSQYTATNKSTVSSTSTGTTTTRFTTTQGPPKRPAQRQGIILQWAHPWGVESEPPYEGQSFGNCRVTYNRLMYTQALAVVFHYTEVPNQLLFKYLPRNPHQAFVWHSLESPWVVRWIANQELREFDRFFNLTMTYRRDSDVYAPYNLTRDVYNILPKGKGVVDQLMANKKRIAVWVVSECSGKKGAPMRMAVADEIAQVIPSLERYGECFGGRRNDLDMPRLVGESKFYLSFENSLYCRDYITEKLYRNGFEYGAVPVVWGTAKEDYLAVAPPHSFIHVEDFASPTELAKYLLYLDSNDTAYREYFKWREEPEKTWDEQRAEIERLHPGVKTPDAHTCGYEKLCEMVMNGLPTPKVIPSLREVFFENDSEECVEY